MTLPIASLWTEAGRLADRAPAVSQSAHPLEGEHSADVVVVGAGAAGLQIALRLHEQGANVVVLERQRVGSGITAGSTAKVTALHGAQSSKIRRRHGADVANAYLEANRIALDDIRATIERLGISCGFTAATALNYATTVAGLKLVEEEAASSRAAGLAVELRHELDLPFPVRGAVALAGQAHLDPRRWCEGLVGALDGGTRAHEQTAVLRVDEDDHGCTAVTERGSVHAEHAVIATHAPIVDPRYLTVRCQPHRSYALAAQLDAAPPPDMYLSLDEPVRSLRPAEVDGVSYLVVAGEGHPVADEADARDCLAALEEWTRQHFPVRQVDYRWAAHDQMSADDLPFIGQLTPGSRRWVATGFHKWGLTTSAVAASIISEGIAGGRHPAAHVFDPTRLRSTLTGELVTDVARVASRYLGDNIKIWRSRTQLTEQLAALHAGDSAVLRSSHGNTAVHRDASGALHAVRANCTHEGCLVRFNRAQTSWDCPCHGSRFSIDGEVLCGPARHRLAQVELNETADDEDPHS